MTVIEKILFEFYSQLLLQLGLCCWGVKHWPKSTWGKDGSISCLNLQAIIEGSKNPEQGLRLRPWKTELLASLLAPFDFLSNSSYAIQAYLPRHNNTHSGLSLLHQAAFKKMSHRHVHKPIQCRQHFSWCFLFLGGPQWQYQLSMTTVFNYAVLWLNIFTIGETGESLCAQGQSSL